MVVKIRFFLEKDAKRVQEIARKAWHHTYKEIFTKNFIDEFITDNYSEDRLIPGETVRNSFWVAEEEGEVVGFAQIGYKENDMYLWRLYLDPLSIGKGIGSKLLETVENFLMENEISEYFVEVHSENRLGMSFYMRKEFIDISSTLQRSGDCDRILVKRIRESEIK